MYIYNIYNIYIYIYIYIIVLCVVCKLSSILIEKKTIFCIKKCNLARETKMLITTDENLVIAKDCKKGRIC